MRLIQTSKSADPLETLVRRTLLKQIRSSDVSFNECLHYLLSMPMYFCNRVFVNLNPYSGRELTREDSGSVSLRKTDVERYEDRSSTLDSMCLFRFMQSETKTKSKLSPIVRVTAFARDPAVQLGDAWKDDASDVLFWRRHHLLLFRPFRSRSEIMSMTPAELRDDRRPADPSVLFL